MLVLTRRTGETIVIEVDGQTVATLTNLGPRTRLGIDAPESVKVYREEMRPADAVAILIREAA